MGEIDDPWGLSGKSYKAPKREEDDAEMPEPLPTILLEETLPVTPRELWLLVMGSSDLLKSVAKVKKNRDLKIGRWRLSKGIDRVHEPLASVMDIHPQELIACPQHTSPVRASDLPECQRRLINPIASAGDTAERKISYITPFKKQIVGPKEAKAIEVYESTGVPHQGFVVDVKVYTPEVSHLYTIISRALKTLRPHRSAYTHAQALEP